MYDVVRLADGVVVAECPTYGSALSTAAAFKRRWRMKYEVVQQSN